MFPRILEFPKPQYVEGGAPEWAPFLSFVVVYEVLFELYYLYRRAKCSYEVQRGMGGGSGTAAAKPLLGHAFWFTHGRVKETHFNDVSLGCKAFISVLKRSVCTE